MSEQEFLAGLTGRSDDLDLALEALRATGQPFCLIGGLAVNHYVEPVLRWTNSAPNPDSFTTGTPHSALP